MSISSEHRDYTLRSESYAAAMMKLCSKCKTEKSISEFYAYKSSPDGLRPWCKECWKQHGVISKERKAAYDREREASYAARRKALKADPTMERRIERHDGPTIDDEFRREYNRKLYEKDIEKNRAKSSAWQKTERGRISNRNQCHKRRLRIRETDITLDWLLALKTAAVVCLLCSVEMTDHDHLLPTHKELDHIIPLCVGGSHTMDNVRYICRQCNIGRPKSGDA